MIVFYNPKATKPHNRRLPLSILAIAATLEGKEEYAIIDGNLDPHPTESLVAFCREHSVDLLAVTVMPGPQTVGAVVSCREVRARFPHLPIVWGGYFRDELHRCCSQRGLCGLRRSWPGRADFPRFTGGNPRSARSEEY